MGEGSVTHLPLLLCLFVSLPLPFGSARRGGVAAERDTDGGCQHSDVWGPTRDRRHRRHGQPGRGGVEVIVVVQSRIGEPPFSCVCALIWCRSVYPCGECERRVEGRGGEGNPPTENPAREL